MTGCTMWTFILLSVWLAVGLAQDHIGEDHLQDHGGEPLVFMAMGDWGTDSLAQRRVAQAMANYADDNPVDFVVSLGDNFYDGVNSADDEWFDTRWRDIYMVHESLADMKWYITVGNHDYLPGESGKEWNQVARHPIDDQWYFPHLWYCIHIENTAAGKVDLYMMDTEALIYERNNWDESLEWLEEELKASDADWKMFVGHHPSYTIGYHYMGSAAIREYLDTLMEEYDVDMYLNSHDHNMQHLKKEAPENAPDYILMGGGGRSLYAIRDWAEEVMYEQYGVIVPYAFASFGFGVITFDEDGMHVDAIDDNDELLYTYTRRH